MGLCRFSALVQHSRADFTANIFPTTGFLGSEAVLTSVVFGVTLLQGSGGLNDALIETFDQGDGGGSLSPADRVAVRPRPNRFLQNGWDTKQRNEDKSTTVQLTEAL